MYLLKCLYYNFIVYRRPRYGDHFYLTGSLEGDKHALTEYLLNSVGLTITVVNSIPWYVPLSKVQREWRDTVAKAGYSCGLLY